VSAPNAGKTSDPTGRRTIDLNEVRTAGRNEGSRMAMTVATAVSATVARHLREAAETSAALLRIRTA